MQLVEFVPITRGVFKESLTYFSAKEMLPGALVSATVRGQLVDGLVTKVTPIAEAKAAIRQADFALKKITAVKAAHFFEPHFLSAVRRVSDYFATSFGLALAALVPKIILDNAAELAGLTTPAPIALRAHQLKPDKQALQTEDDERFAFYRSLIREQFARGQSVFLLEPTASEAEVASTALTRGIGDYTILLHNELPKKVLLENWRRAVTEKHPLLIIATPLFLALPRADIKTIICERESASAYKQISRPFLNYRQVAELVAEARGCKYLTGDLCLTLETGYGISRGLFQTTTRPNQRTVARLKAEVVKAVKDQPLSAETLALVASVGRGRRERTIILTGRRGLAPTIVCQDCGETVVCANCHTPLSLHETAPDEYKFVCHQCNARRPAAEKCANCGGWRLRELGSGSEKIVKQLKAALPAITLYQMDSDKVKTRHQATKLIAEFLATPGAILVGTELILHHLAESVENVVAVGLDGLLAVPDFRIREKIFQLLLRARSLTSKHFVIETRRESEAIWNEAARGELHSFYRRELAERETFGYPPFKLLIKVELIGKGEMVKSEIAALADTLKIYQPLVYPPLHPPGKRQDQLNLLIKLDPENWPLPHLLEQLRNLPPRFSVSIDPQHIL